MDRKTRIHLGWLQSDLQWRRKVRQEQTSLIFKLETREQGFGHIYCL